MKRMTWDEMVTAYPDKWIAVQNAVMDGPDVMEGDVLCAVNDEDIGAYEDAHDGEGLIYRRTTESGWNGMFYADFSIKAV